MHQHQNARKNLLFTVLVICWGSDFGMLRGIVKKRLRSRGNYTLSLHSDVKKSLESEIKWDENEYEINRKSWRFKSGRGHLSNSLWCGCGVSTMCDRLQSCINIGTLRTFVLQRARIWSIFPPYIYSKCQHRGGGQDRKALYQPVETLNGPFWPRTSLDHFQIGI